MKPVREIRSGFSRRKMSNNVDGPITVIPDRNCPAKTAFLLQLDTWKLRSLGKVPHVLTYGMEGLEALRVGRHSARLVRNH